MATASNKQTINNTPMKLRFPGVLWSQRELWWRLTERDVIGRYKGSFLGVTWSFLNPLAMLAVYTFVFSHIFKARWGNLENEGPLGFAINLFAGLIVFNMIAECLTKAPGLIVANPNYVKKVIFPLEVLPCVAVGSALFHALTSLVVLAGFQLIARHGLPLSSLWLPIIWLPLLLGCLAVSWVLASLGVFLRDIGQFIAVLISMLMFLSPIFYPASALPSKLQPLLAISPITQVIEQTRRVLVTGNGPSFAYIIVGSIIAGLAAELGLRFFQKSKRAFADVI
jgi:lipopolysaccharide transport system permease protein